MNNAINTDLAAELIITNIIKDLGNGNSRVIVGNPLFEKMMQTSRANWKGEKPSLKWSLVVDEEGNNTNTISFAFKGKDDEIVTIYYYSHDTGEIVNVPNKEKTAMVDKPVYKPIFFMDSELAKKYLVEYTPVAAPFNIKEMDFDTEEEA